MRIEQLLKFHRYLWAWENYLLLARVISSAFLVRRNISDRSITPQLGSVLPVIDRFYLPPQPGWQISDAKKIAWFANFIVNFPFRWGRCLQKSLIVYRLLNGYGNPARLLIGMDAKNSLAEGHVWVVRLSDGNRAFAESFEPRDRYIPIFTSLLPQ